MSKRVEIEGKKFNNWLVIRKATSYLSPSNQIKTYWLCKCICGKEKEVITNSLVSGKSKSCGCLKYKKSKGLAARRNVYLSYRRNAQKKNRNFDITEEQFHTFAQQPCYYCGSLPTNVYTNLKMNGNYSYNGMDRVDNNKGYTLDNIVSCCKNCNLAKRQLSKDEFLFLIRKIYERHINVI